MNALEKSSPTSLVLEHPAADREAAICHFSQRLSVETDPSDVHADLQNGVGGFLIVDPRSREAYASAHIAGAISLPHREIDERTTAAFSKDRLVVTYCWGPGCNAGTKAALRFAKLGFKVKEMIGGFEYWVAEGYPVEGDQSDTPPVHGV
ncbi:MAG TPA: rhodanese-like domain-containing protein [Fimbriimonas sp.]|nr:rhodanese-like domain-containing protein [Fimbriimonas sp.]